METDCDSYNPISIKKPYEQQKYDLLKILHFDQILRWTKIQELWKNAIELGCDPTGWNALWKLSRESCLKFNVPYPTNVIVMVDVIDLNNLSANVSLVAFEELDLPVNIPNVPLIHLFPTVEQENTAVDAHKLAEVLSDLRIFFNYLWYPWDDDKNANEDWLSLHFENRLNLYFDTLNNKVQPKVLSIIKILIEDGYYLHKQISELEDKLIQSESDCNCNSQNEQIITSDVRYLSLCQLQMKLNRVCDELNFYEKRDIRNLLEKNQTNEVNDIKKQLVSVAWRGGNTNELLDVIQKVNSCLMIDVSMRFKCSESLEKLITDSAYSEKLFLADTEYSVSSRTRLRNEILIQGIDNRNVVVITDSEDGLCLFEVLGTEVSMKNVKLVPIKVKYAIIVLFGTCILKDVNVSGSNKAQIGIYIHGGAELVAKNCCFSDFSTAIRAEKDSSVILRNCTFENNLNGLEFEESSVSIDSCKFRNNDGFALLMENSDFTNSNIKRDLSVLEDFQGVKMIDVTFDNNKCNMAKCS